MTLSMDMSVLWMWASLCEWEDRGGDCDDVLGESPRVIRTQGWLVYDMDLKEGGDLEVMKCKLAIRLPVFNF